MKIQLPLETWTELFGFVPRFQLKQIVPHFGEKRKRDSQGRKCRQTIGDRQFVSFVQFYLHKFGEVKFDRVYVFENRPKRDFSFPLADVPIPENVKNFKSITIRNYGESGCAFLQKFQSNSLLANVHLFFFNCPEYLLQIMTNFLPLFESVNSIAIEHPDVLDKLQREYSELAIPMLTAARYLFIDYNGRDIWYCEWLRIPREDGKPRVLFLYNHYKTTGPLVSTNFIKHIQTEFLGANQAVCFFIKVQMLRDVASVQSLTLENVQTREKLVIKGKVHGHDPVTISRYPMGMGTNEEEWIEEMSQHPNRRNRFIEF